MNVNLQTTRQWYESHDMLSEYYKKYKCINCKFYETCMRMTRIRYTESLLFGQKCLIISMPIREAFNGSGRR